MTTERFHLLLGGIIEVELDFARERARTFASGFRNFAEFLSVPKSRLVGPMTASGKPVLRLKDEQIELLHKLRKKRLNAKQPISENYIAAISRKFATRQVEMIRAMNLDSLSVNPLLVKVLNIHTPRELVSF